MLRSTSIALSFAFLLVGTSSAAAGADDVQATKRPAVNGVYLVRMAEAPVVAYAGGIPGLRATRPPPGQKIDPRNPDVVRYVAYLDSRHDQALAAVGPASKLYDYRYALNGFAARLTAGQAARLARDSGVLAVEADAAAPIDTVTTPTFLGLTAEGGLWDQLGGPGNAGEGVVIGVIDTGVWPEHPSFSDRTRSNANGVDGKLDYLQLPGWHGKCVPGQGFNASMCNQKLIGCQFYVAGFGAQNVASDEFLSCRDSDGHGTHTAGTAGGNHGVPAVVDGISLGNASGMAPRARISVYKTCWRAPGVQALCFGSDRAAAIDQAVADGVDVLNHSIGATQTNFLDQVQVAFLFAARAGVFVAASGGNSGPRAATVASPGPWLTTVAASTHDRFFQGSVTLGNGATFTGASLTAATAMRPLVYSSNVGVATDPTPGDTSAPFAERIRLCFPGHLDPAGVAGNIVLCDRGINARVDKSLAVAQAGGEGMILRNIAPTTGINADLHFVPTVHVESGDGVAIKAYLDANVGSATAQLSGATLTTIPAPFIAGFSSRGPIRAAGGDILKPDLTAPGVDILAPISPWGDNGRFFDFLSGTSMSSPHVAGLAALFKQRQPSWSPMMIKSALMTTATHVLGTGPSASPFAEGAGHVAPNAAVDPGLVYDHGFRDWVNFICGTGQLTGCAAPIDPSDLNQASIAIGDVAGVQTVPRTVKNVGPAAMYTASVVAPPGFTVSVTPGTLTVPAGGTASYSVTFTRTTAAFAPFPNGFQFGSLTWSDGAGHSVRSPLVVRPVRISAPASIALTGASGTASFDVRFGFAGPYALDPRGLPAATKTEGNVTDDPTDNFDVGNPAGNQGIFVSTLTVPAGTVLTRIALFDAFTDGNDDLDLFIFRNSDGAFIGVSAGATSEESVTFNNLGAGAYTIYVHGFATDGPDANFTLFTWTVGAAAGNLTATGPPTAVVGATGTVNVSWTGLAAATKYLGLIRHVDAGAGVEAGRTIVTVDTP